MTCRHCQELLSPHLDGMLSQEDAHSVLTHLAQCGDCSKYFSQLEQNRQLVRALPAAEVTDGMKAQLLSRVQKPKSRAGNLQSTFYNLHSTIRRWPMLSYGTVATCAASLLFYFVMMQAPPKVSAEEVVASMDQLISTLDPDEGERAITEETPDEVLPDWSNEIDGELFEDENEQD